MNERPLASSSSLRCIIIAVLVLTCANAACAEDGPRYRYIDHNEPLRRAEREKNAAALASVKGDAHFANLLAHARWIPSWRRRRDIALGGPFAAQWMYDASAKAHSYLATRSEPLPPDMRVDLARRYVIYKQRLHEAKAQGALPQVVNGNSNGRFQLSATETNDLRGARRELEALAGSDAVKQLDLELYPRLPDKTK